jgi:hypothetical protein
MVAADFVVFLPRLAPGEYSAINYLSYVYPNSIGWSVRKSTLEAISHNLSIVTLRYFILSSAAFSKNFPSAATHSMSR